jgi:hypothetical protein
VPSVLLQSTQQSAIVLLRYYTCIRRIAELQTVDWNFAENTFRAVWLSNAVREAVASRRQVGIAFVDLKDAFPSVDHNILLKKIAHYGVRGELLKWLACFVSDRSMHVYEGVDSETVVASRGVPQGSALGPLLFLVYYNDIVRALSCQTVLFADDTALLVSADTSDELVCEMNSVLRDLKHYLGVNKLTLNIKKTECVIPFADVTSLPAVKYDECSLSVVSSFKYLGVYIDNRFSWSVHVQHVISKVKGILYMMYRSRYCCCVPGRMLLFTAMIQPHFLYCAETWRTCNQTLSGAVEILYRHCLRIVINDIAFKPKVSNVIVYKTLDVLPLSLDFQLRAACLLFTIIKQNTMSTFSSLFRVKSSRRSTREGEDELQLQTPFTRYEHERSAFSWWGSLLWNGIPRDIRSITTLGEFRQSYRAYLKERYSTGVNLNRKFYDFI